MRYTRLEDTGGIASTFSRCLRGVMVLRQVKRKIHTHCVQFSETDFEWFELLCSVASIVFAIADTIFLLDTMSLTLIVLMF